MNAIQRELWAMMRRGDPMLRSLFLEYVQNMGHSKNGAEIIVETVLKDRRILNETRLSKLSRFDDEEI